MKTQTHGENHVLTEAETGMRQLQAKEHQGSTTTATGGRGREVFSLKSQRECGRWF